MRVTVLVWGLGLGSHEDRAWALRGWKCPLQSQKLRNIILIYVKIMLNCINLRQVALIDIELHSFALNHIHFLI